MDYDPSIETGKVVVPTVEARRARKGGRKSKRRSRRASRRHLTRRKRRL